MHHAQFRLTGIIRIFLSRQALAIGATLLALALMLTAPIGLRPAFAATTWTVTTNGDASGGPCSPSNCDTLRDAMTNANSGDTVVFSISNTTITLGSTLPDVTKTLTIDGTGQNVTISGNNAVEVFTVNFTGSNGNLTLKNLTIANGKTAGRGGGIANNTGGTLTISNSTFSGNSSTNNGGGGVDTENGGTVTISNSTFSGNSAGGGGGGLFIHGATVTISNSTFSGNSANSGGGVFIQGGTVNLGSTIVAGNTGSIGPDIYNNGGTMNTLGHNLVGDGSNSGLTNGSNGDQVGTSASPINPLLGPLAANGGLTQTMALPLNSPAFGKGNCNLSSPASPVTTDQRGQNRKVTCDVGAFEETFTFSPTGPALPGGTVGATYSPQTIQASGGTGSYTYGLLSGPPGLSINSSSGSLSGVPTAAGTYNFSVEATDSSGIVGAVGYSITVAPGGTSTATNNVTTTFSATNQPVTLTATVTNTSNPGTLVNEGTVTFSLFQDAARTNQVGSPITSGTVTNGVASASFTLPGGTGIGQYYVKAVYNPGPDFTGSSDTSHLLSNFAASSSTITVSTINDVAANANCNNPYVSTCALRTAMEYASTGDTITFGVSGTITLGSTLPDVTTTLTIDGTGQNVTISGNNAVEVFTVNTTGSGGNLTLNNLTVANGKTTGGGGGMFNFGGVVTISNSAFSGNSSTSGFGGGLYNLGTATIIHSTFSGNSATSRSGGGVNNGGALTISNSIFANNSALGGAGVDNGGTLTINNSTFSGNSATNGAGGGLDNSGTLTISNSTFSGNSAGGNAPGGGIFNFGGTVAISNSTFSGNSTSTLGGGMDTQLNGTVTISNSTFSGNTAGGSGGGVFIQSGTVNVGSNIFAGNTVGVGGAGPDISGTVSSLGYNVIGNTSQATGFVATDQQNVSPKLSALGSYGGPTQTFLLLPGSPAIGKGNCAANNSVNPPAPSVSADQRGVARKVVGIGCDAGAFEDFGISPASLPGASEGHSYSQQITASGGTAAYTFSNASGLPNGITLTSGGLLNGTPTQGGAFSFTFTATDSQGNVVQWGYQMLVSEPDTIGVYRTSSGLFLLRNTNTTGTADIAFAFQFGSRPYPVAGDWTTGGSDTVGLYDRSNGQYFLRNSNTAGSPDEQFVLGIPNDESLAGQWISSGGHDGVGVFRPSNGLLLLRNSLTTGFADYVMVLGIPGDQGLTGDWKGQSYDSPGVYRPASQLFLLSNQVCNCSVFADYVAQYGNPGDNPVTGDWTAQGHAGIGVFRPTNGLILLKNQIATGFADIVIVYGIPNDVPIAGHWTANMPAFTRPPNVLVGATAAPVGTPRSEGNLGG